MGGRLFIPAETGWQTGGLLTAALGLSGRSADVGAGGRPQVISVVGSGGKTTACLTLAQELAALGYRVLVTTTTHMMAEPAMPLVQTPEALAELFKQGVRVVMGGRLITTSDGLVKMKALELPLISALLPAADFVLCEADGSAGHPAKLPNWHEPVYLPETDLAVVVFGLSAIGQPFDAVCHRLEEALTALGRSASDLVTTEDAAALIRAGYLKRADVPFEPDGRTLNRYAPHLKPPAGARTVVLLNQADDETRFRAAVRIAADLAPAACVIARLGQGDRAGGTT